MVKKYPLSVSMTNFVNQSLSFFPTDVVTQGIDAQRLAYRAMTSHFACSPPSSLAVEDGNIGNVSVRRYIPENSSNHLRILFAHGGGWYLGNLDSHDSFCAHLANDCGVEVIAIDYSLAPESPFPAGLDDIERVYQSLAINSSPAIMLMGDSAGANLMAALSLRLRRKGQAGAYGQCFIYPALSKIGTLASHGAMSDAPLLDLDSLNFCWEQYIQTPNISALEVEELMPLEAQSHELLPNTMLFAAEFDPLVDDARNYQQALQAANVSVQLCIIRGLVHGGLHGFNVTEEGGILYSKICDYVRSQLDILES